MSRLLSHLYKGWKEGFLFKYCRKLRSKWIASGEVKTGLNSRMCGIESKVLINFETSMTLFCIGLNEILSNSNKNKNHNSIN